MQYIFTQNKDGHKQGEIIELEPSDFHLIYWTKKQVIEPFFRENELEIEHQDPVVSAPEIIPEMADSAPKKRVRKKK